MKRVAIGIRVHSGWGALVAVCGPAVIEKDVIEEVIERRRITIVDADTPGTTQPYHFAQTLNLEQAERHIARCRAESSRLALEALRDAVEPLRERDFTLAGAAVTLSSGRPLPPLPQILASHALIHAAEGEFFRQAFVTALEQLAIPVTRIRERELEVQATAVFGRTVAHLSKKIDSLGRVLGPPWTQDQKVAALAAAIVLGRGSRDERAAMRMAG